MKENKPYINNPDKKFRKPSFKTMIAVLALVVTISTAFTGCSSKKSSTYDDYEEDKAPITQRVEEEKETTAPKKVSKLENINAKIKIKDGKTYIDEESCKQIIEVALKDAQDFYRSIGAPNMKYNRDAKNPSDTVTVLQGEENFYPDWMNSTFYMARAFAESTFQIDAKTKISESNIENDAYAQGLMQICPNAVKNTLESYYKNTFHETVNLDKYNPMPSKADLEAVKNTDSKDAKKRIVQSVYDNVYLSITYDIYRTKCKNPQNHADFYEKYGGFKEDARKLAIMIGYTSGDGFANDGLRNGNLKEKINQNKDYKTYIKNMENYIENEQNKDFDRQMD